MDLHKGMSYRESCPPRQFPSGMVRLVRTGPRSARQRTPRLKSLWQIKAPLRRGFAICYEKENDPGLSPNSRNAI